MRSDDPAPAPVVINGRPRPRVLVQGFGGDVVDRLREFLPTVRAIDYLGDVRQEEWDALVTRSGIEAASPHLFVLVQAPDSSTRSSSGNWNVDLTQDDSATKGWFVHVSYQDRHMAEELMRHRDLPQRIERLSRDVLEPIARDRDSHGHFVVNESGIDSRRQPFLSTSAGAMLAGRYSRHSGAEVWLLPKELEDIVPWVRAAIAEWNALEPSRFPGLPDWSQQNAWLTNSERRIKAALETLSAERLHMAAYFEERARAITAEADSVQAAADLYDRALLTADSDHLVEAVMAALRELGFSVVNADDHAAPGDNLEDLHITDPERPGWLAIAEVKGYTKGASTGAFQQLARFSKRYLQRTGASPDAEWYIANQFRRHDPSVRQPILHGKDEDVRTFADDNGLIIDTVVLFQILDLVRTGVVTEVSARDHLRMSRGVVGTPGKAPTQQPRGSN
ncbi:hypothetical protein [Kribbella endophytica]